MRSVTGWLALTILLLAAGCQREQRNPRPVPARSAILGAAARESDLVPGGPLPWSSPASPYAGNAWAINEGQRLYTWFNCAGCHSGQGGGGMGPALNDKVWIYGGEPAQIFDTVVRGRPNGMPSWGGRIPEDQIWQIVAYVRSLSGEQPKAATPARSDNVEPDPRSLRTRTEGAPR